MRKKILTLILFMFLGLPVFSSPVVETPISFDEAKPLEIGVTFDWVSKSQLQRDENIKQIQDILFSEKTGELNRKEFKKEYSAFWKNRNYTNDYEEISKGKKEDADKYYCGFYWNKLLVAYGIQYKNNLKNIYYYDSLGSLRWVDIFSDSYPKYPYWSYQYYRTGKMAAAYYYVSDFDQYVFGTDKSFRGRWYKDKLYNKNAKVIMTRTSW